MDCHEAQRTVSEKLDGEQLDPQLIAQAKEHCRGCPDCSSYVRALVEVQRLPIPKPPADLPDRIVAAVRDEATKPLETRPDERVPNPPPSAAPPHGGSAVVGKLVDFVTDPRNRRAVAGWSTAAAALLIVASVTAIGGLRQITSSPQMASEAGDASRADMAVTAAPESAVQDGSATTQPAATAPPTIVVSGVVYQSTGAVSGVETSSLSPVGTTRSSLDVAGAPVVRDVLGLQDPARVYVVNDAGELLGFDRVARDYRGKVYALSSGELLTYGLWPTWPAGVAAPSTPNGMPEYVSAGPDSLGVEVFRPAAGGTEAGFAIAPGTAPSDPAAGNPGWTWWVPAR